MKYTFSSINYDVVTITISHVYYKSDAWPLGMNDASSASLMTSSLFQSAHANFQHCACAAIVYYY